MIQNLRRSTSFAILLGLACGLSAQKPKPGKPDPWVKDTLKAYKKAIADRKGAKDADAIDLIDQMLNKYDSMVPKDQRAFAKGIAESITSRRVKRKPTQDKIYRTTIVALGKTGANGSVFLQKAFENKAKFKGKEWLNLRADMLEHLGRCKDTKAIDFLLDVALKDPNDTLMASAGGALKYFKDLKLAQRKGIAKDLIKKFAQIYDNANKNLDPGDLVRQTWQNRLQAVSDPWNTTLQALTKQHLRSANDWTKFWNKHKADNWDKPLKRTR